MTAAITINSNLAALNTERRLGQSTSALQESFTRLSSGLRINKASDDAAGLSIVSFLNTDKRVYCQGVRNLNDGIGALNIAEGSLDCLSNIMFRLEELATQSANGVLGNTQREALNEEAQALSDEYYRISKTTTFNGINLLDGSLEDLRLQAGYGEGGGIQSALGGAIGTGSFTAGVSSSSTRCMAYDGVLGDLNGDGFLDLVSAGANWDEIGGGCASVQLGNGDGTFRSATLVSSPCGGIALAVALDDLNNDGILDMATTVFDGQDYLAVSLGNGDGSFTGAGTYSSFSTITGTLKPFEIELTDINNDGAVDLLSAGASPEGGFLSVRLGYGDGSFGSVASYANESSYSADLELGDLNGDGFQDLITVGRSSDGSSYSTFRLGQGDGTFAEAVSYVIEGVTQPTSLALGDFNNDGILDLAQAGQNSSLLDSLFIRIGNGDGTFQAAISYGDNNGVRYSIEVGDSNGDGILDLVSAGTLGDLSSSTSEGYTTLMLGNGDGSFRAGNRDHPGDKNKLLNASIGDINSDGVLDIVAVGYDRSLNPVSIIQVSETTDGVSPLLPFDLSTMVGARQALPVFKQKQEQLAIQRGQIGAFQYRLDIAQSVVNTSTENISAAASRIIDVDVASESAKAAKNQILQQAGAAVLAQASSQPKLALQLLSPFS